MDSPLTNLLHLKRIKRESVPFVNVANDPSAAYLSDGIVEGVINDLSAIPELKTMAWTTVSRYRDPQPDLRKLGRQLGVKSVLVGRLLRQGDRLMLQTELVDVASGSQLWGEQYDRNVADSFSLQQQVSIRTNAWPERQSC